MSRNTAVFPVSRSGPPSQIEWMTFGMSALAGSGGNGTVAPGAQAVRSSPDRTVTSDQPSAGGSAAGDISSADGAGRTMSSRSKKVTICSPDNDE
ncbi:hypothetical protein [Streptomyces fumanus]|uniref:hypothetical protein n=1 Tax=Streptomyces fumanus TaxID=67302 RepID=UPI001E2C1D0A|nr:hypothetical protein [Streptomyces fumanus]